MHEPKEPRAPIEAIAFDLDGTLVDSAPDIGHALNRALHRHGLPPFEVAQVREWIGDGPDLLIERALRSLGKADGALPAALRKAFDAATFDAPLAHGRVYEGIPEMLERLRPRWALGVVTNKPTALARAVLEAAGLLPWFEGVWGADEAHLRKPGKALLQRAAQRLAVPNRRLLMVGDSKADMLAAAAAGSPAALAGWGYGAAAARECRPRWYLEHPGELHALVAAA